MKVVKMVKMVKMHVYDKRWTWRRLYLTRLAKISGEFVP